MIGRWSAAAVVTTMMLGAAAAPVAGTGRLVVLSSLGGQGSYAVAMNDRGDLIGSSVDAAGEYQAVVWWRGQRTPTPLRTAGAAPASINERGHIAGWVPGGLFLWREGSVAYLKRSAVSFGATFVNDRDQVASTATGPDGALRAVLWQRGSLTKLPTPAGTDSRAVGLNNSGEVIGVLTGPGDQTGQGVLWRDGRMIRLGTLGGAGSTPAVINDRGQVAGTSAVAGAEGDRPFLWERGRMTDLLAGTTATTGRVGDLNEAGTLTGSAQSGPSDRRPVVWRDGRMIDIGLPGHTGGGSDLNDRGDVTGTTWADPQSLTVPFRWRDGHTTLYPEPAFDIAVTVIGVDRDGVVGVDQETSADGNRVLRSA